MATERISWTSDAPSTEFSLYADRVGQDTDDMTTTVRIYLKAVNRGGTGSFSNYSGEQKASIDDVWAGASHKDNPFLPKGVATGATRWYDGPWNVKVPHGSDGKRGAVTLRMRVSFGDQSVNLTKSFNDFPDIGDVPDAPTISGFSDIDAHRATVKFSLGDSNGSSITSTLVQYATNSDFSNWGSVATDSASQRSVLLQGLNRKTKYYVRARSQNKLGQGSWSAVKNFTTPAELPGPTRPYYIDAQGQTGLHYLFNDPADNGGATIQEYQVGYGTDPDNVQATMNPNGRDAFIYGLNRYTRYYVWSRVRNEVGWGPWSQRYDIQTRAYVPTAPTPTFIGDTTQVSLHYSFSGSDDGGAPVLEYQVGYGTDPNNVQNIIGSSGNNLIDGLQPATVYYVWSRARNVEGWSSWSVRSSIRTVAGIRIRDSSGNWREAVPYVKDNGVWHVAKPFVKSGTWRPSV